MKRMIVASEDAQVDSTLLDVEPGDVLLDLKNGHRYRVPTNRKIAFSMPGSIGLLDLDAKSHHVAPVMIEKLTSDNYRNLSDSSYNILRDALASDPNLTIVDEYDLAEVMGEPGYYYIVDTDENRYRVLGFTGDRPRLVLQQFLTDDEGNYTEPVDVESLDDLPESDWDVITEWIEANEADYDEVDYEEQLMKYVSVYRLFTNKYNKVQAYWYKLIFDDIRTVSSEEIPA